MIEKGKEFVLKVGEQIEFGLCNKCKNVNNVIDLKEGICIKCRIPHFIPYNPILSLWQNYFIGLGEYLCVYIIITLVGYFMGWAKPQFVALALLPLIFFYSLVFFIPIFVSWTLHKLLMFLKKHSGETTK